ncbi:MAG: hypothetical protein U0Y82_08395 [Thermoleophilia bacterium]
MIWNTQLLRGPVRVRFGAPITMQDLREGLKAGRNQKATERSGRARRHDAAEWADRCRIPRW